MKTLTSFFVVAMLTLASVQGRAQTNSPNFNCQQPSLNYDTGQNDPILNINNCIITPSMGRAIGASNTGAFALVNSIRVTGVQLNLTSIRDALGNAPIMDATFRVVLTTPSGVQSISHIDLKGDYSSGAVKSVNFPSDFFAPSGTTVEVLHEDRVPSPQIYCVVSCGFQASITLYACSPSPTGQCF